MIINSRLVTFGYDDGKKLFYMKTADPEYMKILFAEDPMPTEIEFELPESAVRQMCQYLALWKQNQVNRLPEEQLS